MKNVSECIGPTSLLSFAVHVTDSNFGLLSRILDSNWTSGHCCMDL